MRRALSNILGWRTGPALLLALGLTLIGVTALLGGMTVPDNMLRDARAHLATNNASGSVVFVDIDTTSLDAVGVWPWPRSVHARLLDRLIELGATDIVFDVDFSQPSNEADDAAFERSLEAAGGYATLAAFLQSTDKNGSVGQNVPLPRFARYAGLASVNVALDGDNKVRTYPLSMPIGGREVPSVASLFTGVEANGRQFGIDFTIDPRTVPRVSASDVLDGDDASAMVQGRRVVIGASALELRDFFVVPRHGVVPGALLQILAAETLIAARPQLPIGPWPVLAAWLAIIGLGVVLARRAPLWGTVLAASIAAIAIELSASTLQILSSRTLDAAALYLTLGLLTLWSVLRELRRRGEQKRIAEARLRYLATHDDMTGALNRPALLDAARAMIAAGGDIALMIFDLRRFREINDALGHEQGDLLLKQVAARLADVGTGAVGRLGGDSFALVMPAGASSAIEGQCRAIAQILASPYGLGHEHEATIAISAGATGTALGSGDAETLLSEASMALSVAKHMAGTQMALYEPAMADRIADHRALDTALRTAILNRALTVAYQPQAEIATGRVIGAEALMRWTDPHLGSVSPARFIAIAEETGQIVELGRWCLEQACRDAMLWPAELTLSVNVSPVQFQLTDIAADIETVLARTGFDPRRLEIEITEGVFVGNDSRVVAMLERIRALGVRLSLDDFGTGYSSLGYLGRLPVDKLKIDQSFVRRLPSDGEAITIVSAVLTLSRALGKDVCAEGIETEAQAAMLLAAGCPVGQGWLYGRPMDSRDFAALGQPVPHAAVA